MAVYFIKCSLTGLVKIGTAKQVAQRLAELQTGSPGQLVLIAEIEGDRAEEMRLHAQFHSLRERGEWFRYDGALRDYIEDLKQPKKDAPTAPADPRNGDLIGSGALRFIKENGKKIVQYQGVVVGSNAHGLMIELFSWFDGGPTYAILVPWSAILTDKDGECWGFFPTVKDMNFYHDTRFGLRKESYGDPLDFKLVDPTQLSDIDPDLRKKAKE